MQRLIKFFEQNWHFSAFWVDYGGQQQGPVTLKRMNKVRLKTGVLDDDKILNSENPLLSLLSSEKVKEEDYRVSLFFCKFQIYF